MKKFIKRDVKRLSVEFIIYKPIKIAYVQC